ncbi:MAG: TIGR03936 family radical SAM-associated protein [Clostridia bacterium]|nr:TIGR03936 family radical SAM-associated protein [Clostridia bacterium]
MDFIDVRMWFVKQGDLKFISHLDLQRFMQRALKRSGLPLWHTEGFNPHPYVTFALPLSLGQESRCEIVDFRLTKPMSMHAIKTAMDQVMPADMRVLTVAAPIEKAKMITSARYAIRFPNWVEQQTDLSNFLCNSQILVTKRTKKGGESTVDLAPAMKNITVAAQQNDLIITVELPAGSSVNLNPSLLVGAIHNALGESPYGARITRLAILNAQGEQFS